MWRRSITVIIESDRFYFFYTHCFLILKPSTSTKMKKTKLFLFSSLLVFAGVLSCSKELTKQTNDANESSGVGVLGAVNLAVSACDGFTYPDTLFYPSAVSANYLVKPSVAQAGTYGAFPAGLSMNTLNGSINISKSETGLKYLVWFIPKGTTDTCKKYITVSGVNYTDSIYVMTNPASNGNPVYNANLTLPVDCSGGCEFDDGADDDNGNGTADEPPAGQELISKGFAINKATGVIDFKKSIQNGVLGKNPKNGVSKVFTLYYRLGDKSSKALNKISFELFFYKTQAQIPAKLKEDVTTKQGQVLLEDDEDEDDGGHHSGHGGGNLVAISIANNATAKNGQPEVKCRPPYIIVTQQ